MGEDGRRFPTGALVEGRASRRRGVRLNRSACRVVTALALATSLLLVACGGHDRPPDPPGQDGGDVNVEPARATVLRLSSGLEVTVPVGAVDRSGTLRAASVPVPSPAPDGADVVGPVYDITLDDTSLTGQATIRLPVPLSPAATGAPSASAPPHSPLDVALLAYWDASRRAWSPVNGGYDPPSRTVTATTDHLSRWAGLRPSVTALDGIASSAMDHVIGVADRVPAPTCPGDPGTAGARVTATDGNLLRWCAGSQDGAPLLRLANNRGFPLVAEVPAGWSVGPTEGGDEITDIVVQAVAGAFAPAPAGFRNVVLPAGTTVEIRAPRGASGTINTRPNPGAYLATAFLFGIDTLTMTFGKLPFAPPVETSKTLRAVEKLSASKACVISMNEIAKADVSTASGVGTVFWSATKLAAECLREQWAIAYGLTGSLATFLVGTAAWLIEGAQLTLAGLQGAVNSALYWRGFSITVSTDASSQGLRHTDLANIGYPAGVCGSTGRVAVRHGTGSVRDQSGAAWTLEPALPARFADIDGDGAEDAVLRIHCRPDPDGAARYDELAVLGGRPPATGPGLLGIIDGTHHGSGMYATDIRDFQVKPGAVLVEEGFFNEGDPHCCPSGHATVTWRWTSGELVRG